MIYFIICVFVFNLAFIPFCGQSRAANNPPEMPLISAEEHVKVNTSFSVLLGSSDYDENPIRFIINWGDGMKEESEYSIEGYYSTFHKYIRRGVYIISVVADDKTSKSIENTFTIFVDSKVHEIDDVIQGYLVDKDSDTYYDTFFNLKTRKNDITERHAYFYWIDLDSNEKWDYIYDIKSKEVKNWNESSANMTLKIEYEESRTFWDGISDVIGRENMLFLPILIIGAVIIVVETFFVTYVGADSEDFPTSDIVKFWNSLVSD